jgi:hypothetical protein
VELPQISGSPDGSLAGLWPSAVDPLDRKITSAIEAALK